MINRLKGFRLKAEGLAGVVLLLVLLLSGCASVPACPPSPPDDVVFLADGVPVLMPKGFFDSGCGESWMKKSEFDAAVRRQGGM